MVNTMVNYLIQRQIFIGKVQNFTIVLVNKIIKYHLFQSKKKTTPRKQQTRSTLKAPTLSRRLDAIVRLV